MPAFRHALLLAAIGASAACVSSSNPSGGPDAAPPSAIEIEYIAHAAFALRATGPTGEPTELLIDPYASRIWLGYDFPASYLSAGVVAITHPHYDHDFGEFIGRQVPWTAEQTVLRDPGSHVAGPMTLTGVAGKHADPYGAEFDQKNVIWVVEIDGLRIAHLGDNGPLTGDVTAALGRVDVLMMPIDGNEHILTYAEVDAIRAALSPRVVIPMHFRHPDLETDPNSPEDLGPIEPWLETQAGAGVAIDRVAGNVVSLSSATLPAEPAVVTLEHAAAVPPAP